MNFQSPETWADGSLGQASQDSSCGTSIYGNVIISLLLCSAFRAPKGKHYPLNLRMVSNVPLAASGGVHN